MDGTSEEAPFVKTEFDEHSPSLSADGRYLAFESNKSGRFEIYVRTFPSGDREWQASAKGGSQPRWRKDGKELFYAGPDDTFMAVLVTTSPDFSTGVPKALFQHDASLSDRGHRYDVTEDGQFVVVKTIHKAAPVNRIVENWFAEVRRRQKP